ncbi:hypothetical protein [Yimella sp. cx-51]|uniref:hypothetical protein n=1 Tax=Yimella sp. cx-51 TaxID=2770551 RepID=UPI00165D3B81|nr:hypothetical protein [Yimella sp. cx-51]MBC9955662.1 hypothetical protein [Yimella sp. cx-51]QTH37767.1 hypothetical protein J5M86_13080 [Yimella sp. cx-51]
MPETVDTSGMASDWVSPSEWIASARGRQAAGDIDGAYADYEKAWNINTYDQSWDQSDAAHAAGLMMKQQRRWREALTAFDEVISIGDKHWDEAHFHRAVILRDTDEDPYWYLDDDSRKPDRHGEMVTGFRMGLRSSDPGVVTDAREALKALGEEVPAPNAYTLARTDPSAAAEIFSRELEDGDPPAARNAAWQLFALRRYEGRHDMAVVCARQAIRLDPPEAATSGRFQRLADALYSDGSVGAALIAIDAAIAEANFVHEPAAWRLRARLQETLGQSEEAVASREQASRVDDGSEPLPEEPTLPMLASYQLANPRVEQILAATEAGSPVAPNRTERRGLFGRQRR